MTPSEPPEDTAPEPPQEVLPPAEPPPAEPHTKHPEPPNPPEPVWRTYASDVGPDLEAARAFKKRCRRLRRVRSAKKTSPWAKAYDARFKRAPYPGDIFPETAEKAAWFTACAPDLDGDRTPERLVLACWEADGTTFKPCPKYPRRPPEGSARLTELLAHDSRGRAEPLTLEVGEAFVGETGFCRRFLGFVKLASGAWAARVSDRDCSDEGIDLSFCYAHTYLGWDAKRQPKTWGKTTFCEVSAIEAHKPWALKVRTRGESIVVQEVTGSSIAKVGLKAGDVVLRARATHGIRETLAPGVEGLVEAFADMTESGRRLEVVVARAGKERVLVWSASGK